jgi:RNA polymerase sigma factor (sigma-70 family)
MTPRLTTHTVDSTQPRREVPQRRRKRSATTLAPCRSQTPRWQTTQLWKSFRDGDPQSARAVYRSYRRLVYAVAYRILGNPPLAEEATQQTFLNAWRAAAHFDTDRELTPWLAAIARRAAIDVYRRESLRPTQPLDSALVADRALSIEPGAALHDVWEVRRAVEQLPRDEREIVRLQHYEELTHGEIAQRLKIPVGTVKSRSFRAHKRLVSLLGHLHDQRAA